MIDFSAIEEEIRVSAGDVFSPVWTLFDENDSPEDLTGFAFDFTVKDAATGDIAAEALCTVLIGELGKVQTTIDTVLDPRTTYRYTFRILSLGEPTTLATGIYRVMS